MEEFLKDGFVQSLIGIAEQPFTIQKHEDDCHIEAFHWKRRRLTKVATEMNIAK